MLTQEYLKSIMEYDPEYGLFYWKRNNNNAMKNGHRAGTLNETTKYVVITINRKPYRASFLAYLYMTGEWPENEIVHLNGCRWINSWKNLFYTKTSLKQRNKERIKNMPNTVKGVCWRQQAQRWIAYITIKALKYYLGSFRDFENAVCARFAGEQSCKKKWVAKSPARKYIKEHIQPKV